MSLTEKIPSGHETTIIGIMKQFQEVVTIASGASSGTAEMEFTGSDKDVAGKTTCITTTLPDIGAGETARIIITNENGNYLFDNYDSLSDHITGAHVAITRQIPLCKTNTIRVITSAAQAAGNTFTFDINFE